MSLTFELRASAGHRHPSSLPFPNRRERLRIQSDGDLSASVQEIAPPIGGVISTISLPITGNRVQWFSTAQGFQFLGLSHGFLTSISGWSISIRPVCSINDGVAGYRSLGDWPACYAVSRFSASDFRQEKQWAAIAAKSTEFVANSGKFLTQKAHTNFAELTFLLILSDA